MSSKVDTPERSWLARLPWLTAFLCAIAVALWYWPGAFDAFVYDRSKIARGQAWRLVTGHWVHFSASHLFWNLVVLASAGGWLEYRNRSAAFWTVVVSSVSIGVALLAFEPSLQIYAGISGVASGLLIGLATWGLRVEPAKRWLWCCVIGLFAAKVALELVSNHPLNSTLTALQIHSVPLAHLIGATAGALISLATLRHPKPSTEPK